MRTKILIFAALAASPIAFAADMMPSTQVYALTDNGFGDPIGIISFKDSKGGLVLTTQLGGLPSGVHGIHIHENADCGAVAKDGKTGAGLGAGSHFDPTHAGKHLGPMGEGHKGDLPTLTVAANGTAWEKLVAPHLTVADVQGRAIVIHQGGDNFSDDPKPVGGGGPRIACGVIR